MFVGCRVHDGGSSVAWHSLFDVIAVINVFGAVPGQSCNIVIGTSMRHVVVTSVSAVGHITVICAAASSRGWIVFKNMCCSVIKKAIFRD